ncbi:hypothetical protein EV356DRAFT_498626 [Viridothelium virens]|uniref:DUF6594 domain-containing protein n=1 Tax=Viridothelium virens TaxID=1048519 RepID=A0A6A6HEC4_VIRVR|nr:hypothetical protein EV356DRAFT_498626 [Viridothelium virens]
MDRSKDEVRELEEGLQCTDLEKSPTLFSPTSTTKSQSPFFPGEGRGRENEPRNAWNPISSLWAALRLTSKRLSKRSAASDSKKPSAAPNSVLVRQLESCPRGYPNFAAFLDSDESFMVYRRFGYLQSRLLLEKQDELRKLETTLDEWDERDGKQDPDKVNRRDLSEEDAAPRRALFVQIEEKFRDYASLLTVAQQLVSFNKPAASDYKSIINYMNQVAPVPKREAAWVRCREDLVTLRHRREHAWLDSGIEHLLKFLQQRMGAKEIIEYLFRSPETKQKCQGPGVYYDHERINNFASGIIIFAILTLLVVPIYVLYHLVADIGTSRSDAICIGVLLVFTLAFSAILSLFTRARRHEILGSAAAYCAVLVVFLGNVGHNTQ